MGWPEVSLLELGRRASVCKRWQQPIQGAHFLLEHIRLQIALDDSMQAKEHDRRMKAIRTHLKCGRTLPIWLNIRPYDKYAWESAKKQGFNELIWKLLSENARRWGRVDIRGPHELYQMLRKSEKGGKRFENLTDLTVTLERPWNSTWRGGTFMVDAFAEAPKPRNVSFTSRWMTHVSDQAPKASLALPLHQLERYSSNGGGDFDSVLQANPKGLIYPNYVAANFYTIPPQFPVILQKLQALHAQTCNNTSGLALLLDQLVLPSLVELQLRGDFKQEDVLFTKVKNLVERSGCSLCRLELDHGDTDITKFTQLLALMPTLEYLDITRPPDAMLTALILDPSSPDPVLPKLSSLTVEISAKNTIPHWELKEDQRIYACDVQVLRAVLRSRMHATRSPPGSFHNADYFQTLTEFKLGCRNHHDDITCVCWERPCQTQVAPSHARDFQGGK